MAKKTGRNTALFQDDEADEIDQQELLVEVSHLRAQLKIEKDKVLATEEETTELKRKIAMLEGQNSQMVEALKRFEEEARESEKFVSSQISMKSEAEMQGIEEGDEGYYEAKCKVLEKRITAIAKNDCWLRAEVEQAKDQVADARRRQVDAERFLGELLRDRTDLYHQMPSMAAGSPSATGSAIFSEEKAFVEGLPKTIPSRAQRAAGLITALSNSATLKGTVGRTAAHASQSSVPPSARPGNVWATLMNGGAAGKVDFT